MRHVRFLVISSEFALDGKKKDFKVPFLLKPGQETGNWDYLISNTVVRFNNPSVFIVATAAGVLDGLLYSAVGCERLQLLLDSRQRVSKLLVADDSDGLLDPLQQV